MNLEGRKMKNGKKEGVEGKGVIDRSSVAKSAWVTRRKNWGQCGISRKGLIDIKLKLKKTFKDGERSELEDEKKTIVENMESALKGEVSP